MVLESNTITGLMVFILFVLAIKVYYYYLTSSQTVIKAILTRGPADEPQPQSLYAANSFFIEQRNNLSRLLNLKQQKVGQMECEKVAYRRVATSETGGWCPNSSKEHTGKHRTDPKLVAALSEFFKDKYIGSFGDGQGRYKQLVLDSGRVKGYDAYDGAPFCETTSKGRVKFLDLTLPQYGLPLYDWIVSLEVAEHIPQKFESIYIDNIIRHAREGVVLSWAIPGQVGYSHVNNRPFEYIKDLMDRLGFSHNEVESQKIKDATGFRWLKRNINVYRRKTISATEDLKIFT